MNSPASPRGDRLTRLRDGHPSWSDQLYWRGSGLATLGLFALFLRGLCQSHWVGPHLAPSPLVLLACLLAVILMDLGIALTLIGPDLMAKPKSPPPRSRH